MATKMEMDIKDFLRNTLSGAQENPSIATNALIIPIGKRSTFSKARTQIDAAFDKVEASVKKLIDKNSEGVVSPRIAKKPLVSKAIEQLKPVKNAANGGILETVVGIAAGAIISVIAKYASGIETWISDSVKGLTKWSSDRLDVVNKTVKKVWGWTTSATSKMFSSAGSLITKGMKASKDALDDTISWSEGKLDSWSMSSAHLIDSALTYVGVEGEMPEAKIPANAMAKVTSAVKSFFSDMTKMIKDWLWSLFNPGSSINQGPGGGGGEGGSSATSPLINSGGGVDAIGHSRHDSPAIMSTDTPANTKGTSSAKTADMMKYAMDQLRKEGVPEANLRAAAAILVGQATAESGLNPNAHHDGGIGYGIYGAHGSRLQNMLKWADDNKMPRNSSEAQMQFMTHEAMTNPSYKRTREILMKATPDSIANDSYPVEQNFEAPAVIGNRTKQTIGAYQAGEPKVEFDRNPDAKVVAPGVRAAISEDTGDASNAKATPNTDDFQLRNGVQAFPEIPQDVPPANTYTKPDAKPDGDSSAEPSLPKTDAYVYSEPSTRRALKPHMTDRHMGLLILGTHNATT